MIHDCLIQKEAHNVVKYLREALLAVARAVSADAEKAVEKMLALFKLLEGLELDPVTEKDSKDIRNAAKYLFSPLPVIIPRASSFYFVFYSIIFF